VLPSVVQHPLGTRQARDVMARVIYGFRVSVLSAYPPPSEFDVGIAAGRREG